MLDTIMELVKLGNSGRFNSAVYHRFIHGIVSSITFMIGFAFVHLSLLILYCEFYCLYCWDYWTVSCCFIYHFQFQVFSTQSASFLLDLLESKYFKYLDVRYDCCLTIDGP